MMYVDGVVRKGSDKSGNWFEEKCVPNEDSFYSVANENENEKNNEYEEKQFVYVAFSLECCST